MNLFRFYGESESKERLEDNLTRGLALCLKYDVQFLNSFISEIDPEFSTLAIPQQEGPFVDISIQVQAKDLEEAGRVIAVPITTTEFSLGEYQNSSARNTKSPRIDMVIAYGDTVVICEVKRTKENCLAQLKNQVISFNDNSEELFSSLSWKRISTILSKITAFNTSMSLQNQITSDYLEMLKGHFPSWHPVSKLNELTLNTERLTYNIERRLIAACNELNGMQMLDIGGRLGFKLDWPIASELKIQPSIPRGATSIKDAIVELIFWAGDTKRQGKPLFKNDYAHELITLKEFKLNNRNYKIEAYPYLKFASFQRGVASLNSKDILYTKNFTKALFLEVSGRKKRASWESLDSKISRLNPEWKEKSDWESKFENSNRTQVDISMGVCVKVIVKFNELLEAEKSVNGLADYLDDLLKSLNCTFGNIG